MQRSFNEAAGIPRGRRRGPRSPRHPHVGFNEAAGIPRGRHTLTEDDFVRGWASMRPRVFPAEDSNRENHDERLHLRFNEAAGIPRGRHGSSVTMGRSSSRFNEAAGIPRGRRAQRARDGRRRRASMRPRVFPAEDRCRRCSCGSSQTRFNEAAGIPRGRHGSRGTITTRGRSFNEAAGIPRGRRYTLVEDDVEPEELQ